MIRHLALGAIGMIIVGSSVAISHQLIGAPLLTAQAARYTIAAGLLWLWARLARAPLRRPRGREWLWLTGTAATGLVLFNVAVVRGVDHAEPAVIAVAVASVPVLIGVIGPLLQHQRPRRAVVIAAVMVTLGAVIVSGAGRTDGVGLFWAVVTMLCEAAFTLLAVPVLTRLGAWTVSLHAVWIAAVALGILGLSVEGPTAILTLGRADWLTIGYLAALVTAVAFVCWYSAVSGLGPGRAGLLTGIAPVSAALVGALTIGHLPAPLVWVGIGLVIAALAFGLRSDLDQHVPDPALASFRSSGSRRGKLRGWPLPARRRA